MYEKFEHYHCSICGESYPLQEEATKFLRELNERFQVAEIDENGWVWSLAIRGKRL